MHSACHAGLLQLTPALPAVHTGPMQHWQAADSTICVADVNNDEAAATCKKAPAEVGESMLACKTRAAIVAIALAPSAMVVATTRKRLSRQQKEPVAPSMLASSSLPGSWSRDVEDASTVSVGRYMQAP